MLKKNQKVYAYHTDKVDEMVSDGWRSGRIRGRIEGVIMLSGILVVAWVAARELLHWAMPLPW